MSLNIGYAVEFRPAEVGPPLRDGRNVATTAFPDSRHTSSAQTKPSPSPAGHSSRRSWDTEVGRGKTFYRRERSARRSPDSFFALCVKNTDRWIHPRPQEKPTPGCFVLFCGNGISSVLVPRVLWFKPDRISWGRSLAAPFSFSQKETKKPLAPLRFPAPLLLFVIQ